MKNIPLSSVIIMSLFLGLAPFFPEPHIIGKIQWIMGGAKGMGFMDWFDVVLHGTPWVLLIAKLISMAMPTTTHKSENKVID